ncbi:MAG: amidohydrolase [Actinomycetota bacterium]
MISPQELRGLVAEVLPSIVELRRAIHRHPELSFQEFATTERVASLLRDRGLEPLVRPAGTGLTVEVGSGDRAVGFRADLDALPIEEPPDNPYSSQNQGAMHACGHDAHTAIGAGLALVLARLPLPGRVRFIFQPGEESFPGGALTLVQEGVTRGLDSILAFHVDPTLPPGKVGLRAGPITGSADRFRIRLEGPGGHTARPHRSTDLIYAAGRLVTDLPAYLHRTIDPRRPVVIVFGRIQGGTAENVIPTGVELGGTIRTLDPRLWEELPFLLEDLTQQIVAPTGAKVSLTHQKGIPPVVNDPRVVDLARRAISDALGREAVAVTDTSMGAEDFSRYLEEIPGALLRLGSAPAHGECDLHSAGYLFEEAALEMGLIAGAAGLLRLLSPEA